MHNKRKQAAIDAICQIAENELPDLNANMVISGKKTLMDRTGIIVAESFAQSITIALISDTDIDRTIFLILETGPC